MSWSTNRIYDNNGRVAIPVEQRHLDWAIERSSGTCAVALALRDVAPDARRISVDVMWIAYTRQGRRVRAPTPAIAREIILNLDAGNVAAVAPVTFKIHPESAPQRIRPERAAQRRLERAAKRDGVALPPKPRKPPSASVAVLRAREHGLRIYKRTVQAEAQSKPSRRHMPLPEMTKSELRRELERAWANTAALPAAAAAAAAAA